MFILILGKNIAVKNHIRSVIIFVSTPIGKGISCCVFTLRAKSLGGLYILSLAYSDN